MSKTNRSSISWMPHVWEAAADAVQRHGFHPVLGRGRLIVTTRWPDYMAVSDPKGWKYIMFVEDGFLASKHVKLPNHIKDWTFQYDKYENYITYWHWGESTTYWNRNLLQSGAPWKLNLVPVWDWDFRSQKYQCLSNIDKMSVPYLPCMGRLKIVVNRLQKVKNPLTLCHSYLTPWN